MSLSLEAVKKLVPKTQRGMITQEYLDKITESVSDPDIANQFKDNFITYLNVLSTGKYKMEDYINAVKYVSFKLLKYTNIDAYAATFPDRYQRLIENGQDQIDAYSSAYNKNKLVTAIFEQTMVPSYILNAPLYQEALNTAAAIMNSPSTTPFNKLKAAELILQHTKAPEVIKNEFSFGMEQQSTISDLREVTENLAAMYKMTLEKGHRNLKDIAEAKIIDVEPINDD